MIQLINRIFKMSLAKREGFLNDPFFVDVWKKSKEPFGDLNVNVDIIENPKEFQLTAECPGLKKEELKVDVEENMLKISGEKRKKNEKEDEHSHLIERSYGRFERSMQMPKNADLNCIKAKYENGVLNILIPKSKNVETEPQRIQIQ